MAKPPEVEFKLSAYMMGTRANPRAVWGVGLPMPLVNDIPEGFQTVKLHAEDGKFYVQLGDEGIKLTRSDDTAPFAWATAVGIHHVTGMGVPDEVATSIPVMGMWQPEQGRIVVDNPPDIVKRAMEHTTEAPPSADDQFPGSHFAEDIKDMTK